MKVLILGGGASGLMAALSAAQDEQNTVTVLERQSRVGRKLLATGNGRCFRGLMETLRWTFFTRWAC